MQNSIITPFPQDYHQISNIQRNGQKDKLYDLRIVGIPSTGAKSRVETNIKICLQLVNALTEEKVSCWPFIQLPEKFVSKDKKKTSKKELLSIPKKDIISLNVSVTCDSFPSKLVRTCIQCVNRERKRNQKRKDNQKDGEPQPQTQESDSLQTDQEKILIFNTSEMIEFTSGDVILPTRLTCYCRHHDEKTGFRLHFTLSDYNGELIATRTSPPIMITDDHKSRGAKRPRTETATIPLTSTRFDDLSFEDFISDVTSTHADTPSSGFTPPSFSEHQKAETFDFDSSLDQNSPENEARISRVVPANGPKSGGVEVCVLGSKFFPGIKIMFGENESITHFWSETNVVCIVPPSTTTGFVPLCVKSSSQSLMLSNVVSNVHNQSIIKSESDFVDNLLNPEIVMFNYQEDSERALMELALRIVGLKLTGRVEDAKQVAMAIVGSFSACPPQVNNSTLESYITQSLQQVMFQFPQHPLGLSLQNETNHTMLHLSVILGLLNLSYFLITHGADLNVVDKYEMTALHYAAWLGRKEIAKMLIQAGADQEKENIHLQTPRDITSICNMDIWNGPNENNGDATASQSQQHALSSQNQSNYVQQSSSDLVQGALRSSSSDQNLNMDLNTRRSSSPGSEVISKVEKKRTRKRDRMTFNFWIPLFLAAIALSITTKYFQSESDSIQPLYPAKSEQIVISI